MSSPADASDDLPMLRRLRGEIDGYLELEMPEMAEEELAAMPARLAAHPLILDGKMAVLMHRKAWTQAVETGLTGCVAAPGQASFFIHTAFCLHELKRTEEAHLLLISGPASLRQEALFHYNMGCYLSVLGRTEEARDYLSEAFRLDASLRKFARADHDLQAMWPFL